MNKKKKIKASTVVIYVFLSLMLVLYLAPLVWIGLTSFKSRPEIYKAPFGWPTAFHFENYAMAWKAGRLGIAMMNSLFVCVITLILTMVIGSMAAFAIARMRWKLAGAAMVYILIGMMIPVHCVLIPLFVRFAKIGLSNNLWGLILPYLTFSLSGAYRMSCWNLPAWTAVRSFRCSLKSVSRWHAQVCLSRD